jgi:photosystem II stability/assembly factor-like uncharacterized protein
VVATHNGGRTWTSQRLPGGVGALSDLSCPSTRYCWAVGQSTSGAPAVVATTDGGHTWTTQTLPSGVASLGAISCPSNSDCWAVGGMTQSPENPEGVIVATSDGGHTWTTESTGPYA